MKCTPCGGTGEEFTDKWTGLPCPYCNGTGENEPHEIKKCGIMIKPMKTIEQQLEEASDLSPNDLQLFEESLVKAQFEIDNQVRL